MDHVEAHPHTTVILLNGTPPATETVAQLSRREMDVCLSAPLTIDRIIAADGAGNYCVDLNLKPDLLVGDLDSITPQAFNHLEQSGTDIVNIPEQNRSDLTKALETASQGNPRHIVIVGFRGGRTDHFLSIVSAISCHLLTVPVTLLDHGEIIHFLWEGVHEFHKPPAECVSLVSFAPAGSIVSLAGLEYPAERLNLLPGTTGVSNRTTGDTFQVEVHSGGLFLILT